MFGAPFTPLGQSPSSMPSGLFSNGTPSASQFGSIGNGTPFGSPFGSISNGTPFGSPLGGSISGENLRPAFGATSSPLSSITAFGPSSSPAFGSSTPAFGATSVPAFGSSFSSSPGSSIFNQNHGSSFQQTLSTSHDNAFSRSAVFVPRSQSASTMTTGSPSAATTVSAFGGTSNTPVSVFSSPAFGGTSTAFGVSTTPSFGSGGAQPLFSTHSNKSFEYPREDGPSRTNLFGSLSTSTSGASNTSNFGMKSTSVSGNTGFHFKSAPIIGQSASVFGNSNLHGSTPLFGTQQFPSGFGHPIADGLCGGSRVTSYIPTQEDAGSNAKIESLCAMKTYLNKSHEELRLEDYQSGDKGGHRHVNQSLCAIGVVTSRANHLASSAAPSNTSLFPSSPVHSDPFAPQTPTACPLCLGGSSSARASPSLNPFTPLTPANVYASQISSVKSTFTEGSLSGIQNRGSRLTSYTETSEEGGNGTICPCKIKSISAMSAYKNKSHEELRSEDYQQGDKGGLKYMNQSTGGVGVFSSTPQANLFSFPSAGNHSSGEPFGPSSNTFAPQGVVFPPGAGGSTTNSPNPSLNNFCSNLLAPQTPFSSLGFNVSTAALNTTSPNTFSSISAFSTSSLSSTSTTGTLLNSASRPQISSFPSDISNSPFFPSFSFAKSTPAREISSGATSLLSGNNTQPSQPFQFFAPMNGHMSALCGPSTNPSSFRQNVSSSSAIGLNPWANLSSSTTGSGSSDVVKAVGGESLEGQQLATGSTEAIQQSPVTNPFGTPNVVQISVDRPGSTISIQYGISSRPVSDNPTPVRRSSSLRVPQFSLRRNRLPSQKYNAKSDGPKVPFFTDEEKTPGIFKADASFIPRENPRSWIRSPSREWVLRTDSEKFSEVQNTNINLYENGNISLKLSATAPSGSQNRYTDGISGGTRKVHDHNSSKEEDLDVTVHGNQDDEAADLYVHNVGVEAVMPKLRDADYYTEPSIQELAAKEKAEPGSCRHVKDFVVGRHGYGSIKFLGETDIRKLDLDSHVQFNYREVIVYMDESKRPPVGQGLNKPAEVTLLNVKCIGKKTGKQYVDGPKVDQYREMLIKKATEQQAEFISYNPALGEWRFKVQHF